MSGLIKTQVYANSRMIVRDEKAKNTAGGAFNNSDWRVRDLNTVSYNNILGASLASNQITLPAGKYHIYASAPACLVAMHQAKLYNVSDSADVIVGTSERAENGVYVQSRSIVEGIFEILASKVLELRHQCSTSAATNGFGMPNNFTTEVYSEVYIEQLSGGTGGGLGSVSIPVDRYLSTETATMKTWIDGRTIYRKVVNTGALPNNTTANVAHGITFGAGTRIISLLGYAHGGALTGLPLPYSHPSANVSVTISWNTTNISIGTNTDYTTYTSSYVILEYVY